MNAPIEFFKRAWDAYLARDWAALTDTYARGAERLLPGAPLIEGREAVVQTWQHLNAAFPDDAGSYDQLIAQGRVAAGEKRYEGTNTGPLRVPGQETTLPPTGKRVSIAESDFMVVEDGRCTRHTCYFDVLDYLLQLGIAPARGAEETVS
jgi:predicted ester cyclase